MRIEPFEARTSALLFCLFCGETKRSSHPIVVFEAPRFDCLWET
jgi:hypothetical protein